MKELIWRVFKYTKTQRIHRLIEIACKGEQASFMDILEQAMIQSIREQNGEIAEVSKFYETEILTDTYERISL